MFSERSLPESLATVRNEHTPEALILDCESDFETLPPAQAEDLGLLVDSLTPVTYSSEWLPSNTPDILRRFVGPELTIGMPGDGSVVWTRQTNPPLVLCKPRLEGSPEPFTRFLIAEAFVEIGLEEPEHFLGFFDGSFPEFASTASAVFNPIETYQLSSACYVAYLGLQTRTIFSEWDGELFDAWLDAGTRLESRLDGLSEEIATGTTSFTDGAEIACSAIKHAGTVPAPFDALNAEVYLEHGPAYATEWIERTVDSLENASER